MLLLSDLFLTVGYGYWSASGISQRGGCYVCYIENENSKFSPQNPPLEPFSKKQKIKPLIYMA